MSEGELGFKGEVTARDLRGAASDGRGRTSVRTAAPRARSWDWSADELSVGDRRELEALRERCAALSGRVGELEEALGAAERREHVLREVLQRVSSARWRTRRRLVAHLREDGLLSS